MSKSSKPKNVSQPETFDKIRYDDLFQSFLLRAPLLWTTLEKVSEEVKVFLDGRMMKRNLGINLKLTNVLHG